MTFHSTPVSPPPRITVKPVLTLLLEGVLSNMPLVEFRPHLSIDSLPPPGQPGRFPNPEEHQLLLVPTLLHWVIELPLVRLAHLKFRMLLVLDLEGLNGIKELKRLLLLLNEGIYPWVILPLFQTSDLIHRTD